MLSFILLMEFIFKRSIYMYVYYTRGSGIYTTNFCFYSTFYATYLFLIEVLKVCLFETFFFGCDTSGES